MAKINKTRNNCLVGTKYAHAPMTRRATPTQTVLCTQRSVLTHLAGNRWEADYSILAIL